MEGLEILDRGGNVLALVPTPDGAADDGTVGAFEAVDEPAQLIEGSDSDLIIEVTVSKWRSLSILERFVLRAITLQGEIRGKAVWVR